MLALLSRAPSGGTWGNTNRWRDGASKALRVGSMEQPPSPGKRAAAVRCRWLGAVKCAGSRTSVCASSALALLSSSWTAAARDPEGTEACKMSGRRGASSSALACRDRPQGSSRPPAAAGRPGAQPIRPALWRLLAQTKRQQAGQLASRPAGSAAARTARHNTRAHSRMHPGI